jgi:hypothetical protein
MSSNPWQAALGSVPQEQRPRGSKQRTFVAEARFTIEGALLSNEGRTMTEPTDTEEAIAVTSRRRFLMTVAHWQVGPLSQAVLPDAKRWRQVKAPTTFRPTSRNG